MTNIENLEKPVGAKNALLNLYQKKLDVISVVAGLRQNREIINFVNVNAITTIGTRYRA